MRNRKEINEVQYPTGDLTNIFNYHGNGVTFRNQNGTAYVNATEMAKPFSKQPSDWVRLKSTNDFLHSLHGLRGIPRGGGMISVINDGINNGTWMHEDVALEFSRWLSPAFAIWCNDRIKELMRYGFTATQPALETLINNPDLIISLANQLKEERAEKELKSRQLEFANNTIEQQAPKVKYVDEVLLSESLISITTIAKDLGMSGQVLNHKLQEMKVQYRQNNVFSLHAKYQDKGYAKTKTHTYVDSHGNMQTTRHLYWTERGRALIISLIKQPSNQEKTDSFHI